MKVIGVIILSITINLLGNVFEVKLETMGRYVLGGPIYIQSELKNISGKEQKVSGGFIYDYILKKSNGEGVKMKEMEQYKIVPCDRVEVEVIGINWAQRKGIDLRRYYYIKEGGEYTIMVRAYPFCDIGKERGSGRIERTWKGEVRSEEKKIFITYPEGEDKEAYEYFRGDIPREGEKAKELLTHFPTSTYAGWVLARRTSGVDFLYENGKAMIDDILKPAMEREGRRGSLGKDKNGKERWVMPEEEAENYIKYAEKFLSSNGEHILSGFIYARLSLGYLALHSWEDAYKSMNESLKREWPSFLYDNVNVMEEQIRVLEEAKKELLNRGLVKKKE